MNLEEPSSLAKDDNSPKSETWEIPEQILDLSPEQQKDLLAKLKSREIPRKVPSIDYGEHEWIDAPGEVRYQIDLESCKRRNASVICKGKDEKLSRPVIVKVLNPAIEDLSEDENDKHTLELEAKIMASLSASHLGIVRVFDFLYGSKPADSSIFDDFTQDKLPMIIMEYLDPNKMPTLKEFIKSKKKLSPERVVKFVFQTSDTVDHMFEKDIYHADLKPSNIFLPLKDDSQAHVKIGDFGLNSLLIPQIREKPEEFIIGTPQYISPEGAEGGVIKSVVSETFSLAVIIYEMIIGIRPFDDDIPWNVLVNVTTKPFPNVLELDFKTSSILELGDQKKINRQDLQDFFEKALAKNPEKRFQTAVELAEALKPILLSP